MIFPTWDRILELDSTVSSNQKLKAVAQQMQDPRPSNVLIRAFVLIFVGLGIFVLGSVIFNMSRQATEQPKEFREPASGLLILPSYNLMSKKLAE
ncbi:hypothetical protein QUB80_03065 [Chlorogloeopsis sp. ULAP01]|uniref:hypothetical protein n=1 Tax=Chlorogloeopsis sp. ULAP01 TaxID=3056483 RepID=UPI0025AA5A2B|nr:hypothetical protein [Chlorogloeopsis sp. ULAP01]MDM9379683.1 hypothetical protein [Chlorogloeopsis sp. ULAP01]